MQAVKQIPYTVYAENTPNPNSMKFVANRLLIHSGPVEFTSARSAENAPLVQRLFQLPFVTGVFVSGNYLTVSKLATIAWQDVVTELRMLIANRLNDGVTVLNGDVKPASSADSATKLSVQSGEPSELDSKIIGILDEYVRPAVEQDGGAINFHSYKDGVVTVNLRGACSGCPSSSLTLKSGIEAILKQFMPEVKQVVAVEL